MSKHDPVLQANRRASLALYLGLGSLVGTVFTAIPAVVLGLLSLPRASPRHRSRAVTGMVAGVVLAGTVVALTVVTERHSQRLALVAPPSLTITRLAAAPVPPLSMPSDQSTFCQIVDHFSQTYAAASTKRQRARIRDDRDRALQQVLPDGKATDWVGYVTKLHTTTGGKATFGAALPCSTSVGSWNYEFTDRHSRTLIDPSSDLYQRVTTLRARTWTDEGTAVRFSRQFLPDEGRRTYSRKNLTYQGAMAYPRFVLRFAQVDPM